jgi:hypothetical protein
MGPTSRHLPATLYWTGVCFVVTVIEPIYLTSAGGVLARIEKLSVLHTRQWN